jgi:hypothetical protein
MPPADPHFHSFSNLVLTISESSLAGIRTDHSFELRATAAGAEVWRSSELFAGGDSCASDPRFVGWLTSRQVIDLLVEIERSGVYEALPALGLVAGSVDPDVTAPRVSMTLTSTEREHSVLQQAASDGELVGSIVRTVRAAVELAQERALTAAG